ncbi:MAG: hypothetical protein JWM98_2696 [Thermoleophilia bacterium]|nr:hypothetical protein [Thermoleophilia bacterium]
MISSIDRIQVPSSLDRPQAVAAIPPVEVQHTGPTAPVHVPFRPGPEANDCTSCGRAETIKARIEQAQQQGAIDTAVLRAVADTYAASRP